MNTDYKIISFDDHLDLSYLPGDFWTKRMARTIGELTTKLEELRKVFTEELSARADKGTNSVEHKITFHY